MLAYSLDLTERLHTKLTLGQDTNLQQVCASGICSLRTAGNKLLSCDRFTHNAKDEKGVTHPEMWQIPERMKLMRVGDEYCCGLFPLSATDAS